MCKLQIVSTGALIKISSRKTIGAFRSMFIARMLALGDCHRRHKGPLCPHSLRVSEKIPSRQPVHTYWADPPGLSRWYPVHVLTVPVTKEVSE